MNAIRVIFPYKCEGTWVFDDEQVGLVREPFVSGIPEMIDHFVADIPGADHGFRLLFSDRAFPEYHGELEWVRENYDGNWYRWVEHDMEGWLCPALFKYFDKAPEKLYIRTEPKCPTAL